MFVVFVHDRRDGEPVSSSCLWSLEERVERLIERRRVLDLEEVLWSREPADLAASDQYMEEGFATPQEGLRVICHMSSPQIADQVAVAGCDRPPYWSEGHHLLHWIKGGPTELDNLVLLCYRHHRNVHEGGWRVVKSDGQLLTIPPPTRFRPWSRGPD